MSVSATLFGKHERSALVAPVIANNPIGVQVLVFKGEILGKGEQPVVAAPEAERKTRKPGVKHAAAS